jgi:uroporphyrinogen decarboxylase
MGFQTQTIVKDKFLAALTGTNQGTPPIWLMRQAGRYMPEYRAIRARHSFLEMCHNPELIAEVTQLPIRAFNMDAAILFSDILVTAEAFDVGLSFEENKGPVIARPLHNGKDVDHLKDVLAEEKLNYVAQGIKLVRQDLEIPLIGFAGAPFTLASYMIEGGSSRDLKKTKQWLLSHPESFKKLLDKILKLTVSYVNLQIDAGVNAIQIFDSCADHLSWNQFIEFSLPSLKVLVDTAKKRNIPIILFNKNSSVLAPLLVQAAPDAISLDWHCNLADMRKTIPFHIAMQGNLDPDILYAPSYKIEQEVRHILSNMHGDPAFIFNLGHGIKPDTPYDSVKILVDAVRNI